MVVDGAILNSQAISGATISLEHICTRFFLSGIEFCRGKVTSQVVVSIFSATKQVELVHFPPVGHFGAIGNSLVVVVKLPSLLATRASRIQAGHTSTTMDCNRTSNSVGKKHVDSHKYNITGRKYPYMKPRLPENTLDNSRHSSGRLQGEVQTSNLKQEVTLREFYHYPLILTVFHSSTQEDIQQIETTMYCGYF